MLRRGDKILIMRDGEDPSGDTQIAGAAASPITNMRLRRIGDSAQSVRTVDRIVTEQDRCGRASGG
jgi:hypothetical protein